MANWCGGIKLGASLKLINGVICGADATTVDKSKAVSTCGQLWDGALFTVATVGGSRVITLHNSEGEEVGTPVVGRGNCGVGLDGRFFKVVKGVVELQDGFVLTVNVTPSDAEMLTIAVAGDDGPVSPISGTTNQYLLKGIGDKYTVTVTAKGYDAYNDNVYNNGDQTLNVVLQEAGGT